MLVISWHFLVFVVLVDIRSTALRLKFCVLTVFVLLSIFVHWCDVLPFMVALVLNSSGNYIVACFRRENQRNSHVRANGFQRLRCAPAQAEQLWETQANCGPRQLHQLQLGVQLINAGCPPWTDSAGLVPYQTLFLDSWRKWHSPDSTHYWSFPQIGERLYSGMIFLV